MGELRLGFPVRGRLGERQARIRSMAAVGLRRDLVNLLSGVSLTMRTSCWDLC